MVEDRITDGKRIAQLLASELTGLDAGPLADVAVVDADSDAKPSESGTFAYRIIVGDAELAELWLFPSAVELTFSVALVRGADERGLLTADRTVRIESGAAVKSAVDLLRATAETRLE